MDRLKWYTWVVLAVIAISYGIGLVSAIILQDIWMTLVVVVVGVVEGILIMYLHHHKRRLKYPMVPPEARPDIYSPRTGIPRPVHEDIRRMEEKNRRMEKLRKMTNKIRKKKA